MGSPPECPFQRLNAWLIAAALSLVLGLQALNAVTSPHADQPLLDRHLVDVGGGRRLNLVCAGEGSPTIVFLAGSGANLLTWQKVAQRAANMSHSCFYDRAGYGYSDPSPSPSTVSGAADDLHRLLRAARIKTPVVLVGHSLGGFIATVYADRHLDEVAGLVLIDPSFAGQDEEEAAEDRADDAKSNREVMASLKACADLARRGRLATEPHTECFEYAPGRTPAEKAMLSHAVT